MTELSPENEERITGCGKLVAAAIFLLGLGYLAILPPFEGFDETAHYSGMRQIAYTGTIPLRGHSFIDRFVERYQQNAPMPWGSGSPPFDRTGSMTYPSFFADRLAVENYKVYRSVAAEKFAPSSFENWEWQHPPLYYLFMAPLVLLTAPLPFATQIFILRTVSYLLAFTGFLAGWIAVRTFAGKTIPYGIATGYLFYPMIAPMFFPEFARLGNDSLCLFILGITCIFSLRFFYGDESEKKKLWPSAPAWARGY